MREARRISFCAHGLEQPDASVVLTATSTLGFFDNPLVSGAPWVRFYASAPLITTTGFGLGSISIIDSKPRDRLSEGHQNHLNHFATLVMDKLELRRLGIAQRVSQQRFEHAVSTSPDGIVCTDEQGAISYWSPGASRIFGYTAEEMAGRPIEPYCLLSY